MIGTNLGGFSLYRFRFEYAPRTETSPAARSPEASVDELLEQVGLARAALDDAVEVALEEQHRLHVVERQHLARVGAKGRARARARDQLIELILDLMERPTRRVRDVVGPSRRPRVWKVA